MRVRAAHLVGGRETGSAARERVRARVGDAHLHRGEETIGAQVHEAAEALTRERAVHVDALRVPLARPERALLVLILTANVLTSHSYSTCNEVCALQARGGRLRVHVRVPRGLLRQRVRPGGWLRVDRRAALAATSGHAVPPSRLSGHAGARVQLLARLPHRRSRGRRAAQCGAERERRLRAR